MRGTRIRDQRWKVVSDLPEQSFVVEIGSPAYVWGPFLHGLGRRPVVRLEDVAGNEFRADTVTSETTVTATMGVALTGRIVCG